MKNRTAGRLAWFLAGLSMGFVAAAVVFMFVNRGQSTFDFNGPFFAAAVVAFAVLGSLLAIGAEPAVRIPKATHLQLQARLRGLEETSALSVGRNTEPG